MNTIRNEAVRYFKQNATAEICEQLANDYFSMRFVDEFKIFIKNKTGDSIDTREKCESMIAGFRDALNAIWNF